MMGLFRSKPPVEPRIQTLAEMLAYTLTNEITRTGWRANKYTLRHAKMDVQLKFRWTGLDRLESTTIRKKRIPFNDSDRYRIESAAAKWLAWDDERRRAEGLLEFVDAFEQVVAKHPERHE